MPVLAAAARMAAMDDPCRPASITLMGGPIDTRRNPTKVNQLAQSRSIEWFERNVIDRVPWPNLGFLRRVYPGFVQLTGFMQMNLERHLEAHKTLYQNLVKGDCDSVQQHQEFYEEYLAVMDLPAEFYLQTVETVFQRHALPDGVMTHRGEPVDCGAIRDIALMTVEGEKDDIAGGWARPRPPRTCAATCRRSCAGTTSSPASAITACSTAPAGAPRSSPASAR